MPLNLEDHGTIRTDLGQIAADSFVLTARYNTVNIPGFFVSTEGGISVETSWDETPFSLSSRIRWIKASNPMVNVTMDCLYFSGDGGPPTTAQTTESKEAHGLGTFKFQTRPFDRIKFDIDRDKTDREYAATENPLPDFFGQFFFVDAGTGFMIPNSDMWSVKFVLKRYLNSRIQDSANISALTGQLK